MLMVLGGVAKLLVNAGMIDFPLAGVQRWDVRKCDATESGLESFSSADVEPSG
jgi:hypothetical protein